MKRLLLPIAILLPSLGFAQLVSDPKQNELLGQGHLRAGIAIGSSYGNNFVGTTGYAVPHLQYFLKDGWSIRLEGRYNVNGDFLRYSGVGLSSRYYFVRGRRLALFGQAGAGIGQSKFSFDALNRSYINLPKIPFSYQRANAWQTTTGFGIHFRLAKRWSLEGITERAITHFSDYVSYRRWQGSVGVNFQLK